MNGWLVLLAAGWVLAVAWYLVVAMRFSRWYEADRRVVTYAEAVAQLHARFRALGVTVGHSLLPALQAAATAFSDLAEHASRRQVCPTCDGSGSDPDGQPDYYHGVAEPGSWPPCPACLGRGTVAVSPPT